ncbi:MAG: hypothetical protein JWO59_209, partial [Chloroflexi bacterium]|nr:hypothetical protein [Chloroflexota bacterium]
MRGLYPSGCPGANPGSGTTTGHSINAPSCHGEGRRFEVRRPANVVHCGPRTAVEFCRWHTDGPSPFVPYTPERTNSSRKREHTVSYSNAGGFGSQGACIVVPCSDDVSAEHGGLTRWSMLVRIPSNAVDMSNVAPCAYLALRRIA